MHGNTAIKSRHNVAMCLSFDDGCGSQLKISTQLAVVTGSTSGIGLGIANVLAKNGASIVLNGFGDVDEIKSVVMTGLQVVVLIIADSQEVDRLARKHVQRAGDVHQRGFVVS